MEPRERNFFIGFAVFFSLLLLLVGLPVQLNWQVYHEAPGGVLESDRYNSNQWTLGFFFGLRWLTPLFLFVAVLWDTFGLWVASLAVLFVLGLLELYSWIVLVVWAFSCNGFFGNPCSGALLCSQAAEYLRSGSRCLNSGPWLNPIAANEVGVNATFVWAFILSTVYLVAIGLMIAALFSKTLEDAKRIKLK